MTGQEWWACADPKKMLAFLRDKSSDRKLRLFACACCRAVWSMLRNEKKENAVETAERFADSLAGDSELKVAAAASWESGKPLYPPAKLLAKATTTKSALAGAELAAQAWLGVKSQERRHAEQCELLRCIFGNPFRPMPFDTSWFTPAVIHLAQTIYDDRTFDWMPELADALHEAGCDNDEILSHCREPSPHVRGCWALDMILGKA